MNGAFMSLLGVEVALTVAAAAMLLWRGFLDMKEEDHLILDEAESHLVREQASIRHRATMLPITSRLSALPGASWALSFLGCG